MTRAEQRFDAVIAAELPQFGKVGYIMKIESSQSCGTGIAIWVTASVLRSTRWRRSRWRRTRGTLVLEDCDDGVRLVRRPAP